MLCNTWMDGHVRLRAIKVVALNLQVFGGRKPETQTQGTFRTPSNLTKLRVLALVGLWTWYI